MLRTDTLFYLPDDDLLKVDRMSMACSLEARVPLLDHSVVEFAARLPFHWKLKGTVTKHILKEAVKDLLPPSILRQRKQGFSVPVNQWMRGALNKVARQLLLHDRPRTAQWLQPTEVQRLFEVHESGREDLGHHLWALLTLEVWARICLDMPVTSAPPASLADLV
jgi:asparagine synthase (glutamine-hydrolysing)